MNTPHWQAGRFRIDLAQPKIMGIVNLTPDSFSDGGIYSQSIGSAIRHAEQLLKDGADILDIGGESTRPGSAVVSESEEWARVQPVLSELVKWNVPLSLDTRHTAIMAKALEHSIADIINDVAALTDDGAVELLAQPQYSQIGICLMHMQGLPETMQHNPQYSDVVGEVGRYLSQRAEVCTQAGIAPERLVLDPGFGFGKTLEHNILLMQHLSELMKNTGLPYLIGVSRKRMIGELTGEQTPAERVHGSTAAALASVARGAQIVRVHDVKSMSDALKIWQAVGIFEH